MASFLSALQANDAFQAKQAGRDPEAGGEGPGWLRSHPRTPERVARAAVEQQEERPGSRATDRGEFLTALDGMIFGENPAQGFVRGNRFEHPELRIAFEAPSGFRLQNTPAAVVGADRQGRVMRFDLAEDAGGGDLRRYLQSGWVKNQELQDLQSLSIDGQDAAVGFGQVALNQRPAGAMFAAIEGPGGRVYRLLYARAGKLTRPDVAAFERSLRSFRPLSASEAAAIKPLRVEIATVRAGDTVETFARQMDVEDDPRGTFILLTGLDRGRELEPGGRVKLLKREGGGARASS
jgi:predicted Zn-dependent protease